MPPQATQNCDHRVTLGGASWEKSTCWRGHRQLGWPEPSLDTRTLEARLVAIPDYSLSQANSRRTVRSKELQFLVASQGTEVHYYELSRSYFQASGRDPGRDLVVGE